MGSIAGKIQDLFLLLVILLPHETGAGESCLYLHVLWVFSSLPKFVGLVQGRP
jgi:hypothetical protein